jgi:methanethiol S-methyltransferase
MTHRARRSLSRLFCWTGAALFLASLMFCFGTYQGAMGRIAGPAFSALPNTLLNVALFSAFALHHSVFARERLRQRVQQLVSPALERSVYVWIASLLLIAVCAAWRPVYGVAWEVTGVAAWSLRLLQAVGVWLTIRGAAAIDVLELAGVRQITAETTHASHPHQTPMNALEFKTTGPYGWVRHPIYAGWFLVVFCEPTMTATRLVFAATSCLYLLVAIPFEERSLRRTTGGAYERYAAQVPWKLIPHVY